MHKTFQKNDVPSHVLGVCERLEKAGFEAWVVGGCVRDTLLGREPKDWDVATSARPQEVIPLFKRVEPTGIEHGTVSIIGGAGEGWGFFNGKPLPPVEVTTFRGDGDYTDGRRPDTVTFLDDIKGDLARRDFTINAMAFRPVTGAFADPFMGRLDLRAKRIKAVGDAKARFNEDGLRVMRACRFAAQLGFRIESETHEAIPSAIEKFRMVAVERITAEFEKLLHAPRAGLGLSMMYSSRLFDEMFPALVGVDTLKMTERFSAIETLPSVGVERLAALFFEEPSMVQRLRFPKEVEKDVGATILAVISFHEAVGDLSHPRLRRWAARHAGHIATALAVGKVTVRALGPALIGFEAELERALKQWKPGHPPPMTVRDLALNGEQVAEVLDTRPGPEVGRALRWLLEECFEDPTLNEPHRLTKALLTRFQK